MIFIGLLRNCNRRAGYSMSRCRVRAMVKWITCWAIAGCTFASQLDATQRTVGSQLNAPPDSIQFKKLYVEPLNVKKGSEKFRSDMIAQLRKLSAVSIVADKASADAILSGNGEVWVKGYQSLNPRSGRSAFNGTPVYTGFLSVEIKDQHGATLWSYLVTPGSESQDISKDLSKRVAKHLAAALDGEHAALSQRP
jgi:hypothetical protein